MRLLLIALILAGCAGPSFCRTVDVPAQRVTICGPGYVRGLAGPGWMKLWGDMVNGLIDADERMAGHEWKHQIERADGSFRNPDK